MKAWPSMQTLGIQRGSQRRCPRPLKACGSNARNPNHIPFPSPKGSIEGADVSPKERLSGALDSHEIQGSAPLLLSLGHDCSALQR